MIQLLREETDHPGPALSQQTDDAQASSPTPACIGLLLRTCPAASPGLIFGGDPAAFGNANNPRDGGRQPRAQAARQGRRLAESQRSLRDFLGLWTRLERGKERTWAGRELTGPPGGTETPTGSARGDGSVSERGLFGKPHGTEAAQ